MTVRFLLAYVVIFAVVYFFVYRYFNTLKIESVFKPTTRKDGSRTVMLITLDDIDDILQMVEQHDPDLIPHIHSISLCDRPRFKKEDMGLTAAHIKTKDYPFKGILAAIKIYPYLTKDGSNYYLESDNVSFDHIHRMYWTRQEVIENFRFTLCHELGHLRLWVDGVYKAGTEIEDKCDDYARRLLGYSAPQDRAVSKLDSVLQKKTVKKVVKRRLV